VTPPSFNENVLTGVVFTDTDFDFIFPFLRSVLFIRPRESGGGGPRACAVEGALASMIFLEPQKFPHRPRPFHHAPLRYAWSPFRVIAGQDAFVIASVATQSSAYESRPWIASSLALLAMTNGLIGADPSHLHASLFARITNAEL
jgi:hypothetical protein